MTNYSFRILRAQPLRMAFTIGGIALCVVLMLFLLSVYRGVADGSVDYIRYNKTDLWVLQGNATNILRGSSILSTGHGVLLREIPRIKSVSPILFLLSSIKKAGQSSTVYLTGYDVTTGVGSPPKLVEGRNVRKDNEIVLDRSFAAKFHFEVGDEVVIKEDTLKVVGISARTNMFVLQYAFVTLRQAQSQIGYPGLVTCYLVTVQDSNTIGAVRERIHEELPGLEVYDQDEFLRNNIHEMQSGFLPLLYTIAAIGGIVLTTILSLILSINILERRKEFAVMKTLGSPRRFLRALIFGQGLQISSAGCAAALVLFFPVVRQIERISPEVSTKTSLEQMAAVVLAVWGMSFFSSLLALGRVRRIYSLEAFS
jgi:ABC-type antimicrobial peptide transport system permease subunit